jgi:hypothetical protein
MSKIRGVVHLLSLAIALAGSSFGAEASVYQMECREWVGTTDHQSSYADPLGSYMFVYDTDTKALSVTLRPAAGPLNFNALFGRGVKTWTLLWTKESRATFYGTENDFTGPVKILTLDFAKAKAFHYNTGGDFEDLYAVDLSQRECRRLN